MARKKTLYDPAYRRMITQLKEKRLSLKWDQKSTSALVGYSSKWLSKVERMDIRLDVLTFIRVCRVLGLRASRLVRQAEEDLEDDPPLYLSHLCYAASIPFRALSKMGRTSWIRLIQSTSWFHRMPSSRAM